MPVNGYRVKRYDQPVKRYCQTIDLSDNPELIERYKEWQLPLTSTGTRQ